MVVSAGDGQPVVGLYAHHWGHAVVEATRRRALSFVGGKRQLMLLPARLGHVNQFVQAQQALIGEDERFGQQTTALRNLAKCLIIDPQKAHRPCGTASRGVDNVALGAQTAEGKAIAAAGLLDQCCHAQSAENAVAAAPHVVFNGEDEAGRKLTQRRPRAGEGGAVGEETQLGE